MMISSATPLAFTAGCLTAIATLQTARAQIGGTAPGSYWTSPGAYGYRPPPGIYGPPPGIYSPPIGLYSSPPGPYAPQSLFVTPPPADSAETQLVTNGPQTSPGDVSRSWSAQRNVMEIDHYEVLLKGNPAFRQARMRKECGPIPDPQLHRQCLNSFARY